MQPTWSMWQRRQWQPTLVLLPGKSLGWRSLVGCSPWGRWGSDTTEQLHFHFSLSSIGEGNGNLHQRSCLENPRDGGARWAAIYGVAQSRTQLNWFSSSLAWKLPWTEEPGRLQSTGSHGVGHDWATSLSLFTFMHWRRKWQPTPVFLPGEPQGRRSLVGCRLWGRTESDTTEVT